VQNHTLLVFITQQIALYWSTWEAFTCFGPVLWHTNDDAVILSTGPKSMKSAVEEARGLRSLSRAAPHQLSEVATLEFGGGTTFLVSLIRSIGILGIGRTS
jgi:hypothetical protein